MSHASHPLCCAPLSSPKTIELLLRPRMALVRCSTIPPDGIHAIPLQAPTVLVHDAQASLPCGIALLGRTTVPADGFRVIPLYPAPARVHDPEIGLGVDGSPRSAGGCPGSVHPSAGLGCGVVGLQRGHVWLRPRPLLPLAVREAARQRPPGLRGDPAARRWHRFHGWRRCRTRLRPGPGRSRDGHWEGRGSSIPEYRTGRTGAA